MGLTERSFLERMELVGLTEPRAVTNYDRLISKTPEELAGLICRTPFREGDFCPPDLHEWRYCTMADGCRKCWLSWLKAPINKERIE